MRRPRSVFVLVLLAFAAACARPVIRPSARDEGIDARAWVDGLVAGMTVEEKAAQLIFVSVDAELRPASAQARAQLERLVHDGGIGGVYVRGGSPAEIALSTNAWQRAATVPLLVAADIGTIDATVSLPALAATRDDELAERQGAVVARTGRAIGVQLISFDADARVATALARGIAQSGGTSLLRGFPYARAGTRVANVPVPVVQDDTTRIIAASEAIRTADRNRVGAVLVEQVVAGALTGGRALPATISSDAIEGMLRRRLGWGGLVITAPMSEAALRDLAGYSPGASAVWAIAAGADVVLDPPDVEAAQRAIVAAVKANHITRGRLDASVRRLLELKAHAGLHRRRTVVPDSLPNVLGSVQNDLQDEIARRSLVLTRDALGLIPRDARRFRNPAVIVVAAQEDSTRGATFAAEVQHIFGGGSSARIDAGTGGAEIRAVLERAHGADFVVLFLADSSGAPRVRELVRELSTGPAPMIAVRSSHALQDAVPDARTELLMLARGESAERAVARAIAGMSALSARAPAAFAGVAEGAGIDRDRLSYRLATGAPDDVAVDGAKLAELDNVVERSIADRATPGASLAVARHGQLVRLRGYGRLDPRPSFANVTESTIYDLASLTKVVATTMMAMILVEEGRVDLDRPIVHYLPEWGESGRDCDVIVDPVPEHVCVDEHVVYAGTAPDVARQRATVRDLLMHTAGLPAWAPLYRDARGRAQVLRRIFALPLEYAPGTRSLYSDLSMILLQAILERVSGQTMDVFLAQSVYGPLAMSDTRFEPLRAGARDPEATCASGLRRDEALLARIAPSLRDTTDARRSVHGVVHDENACAIGGVSGHAGLFSSARDLAVFTQMLLNGGFYDGTRIVRPSTIEEFTRRQDPRWSRALGWDTPAPGASQGDYFSPSSFGHTGFTGTSIWVDRDRDLFVVLLTNRLNPAGESNQRHLALRRAVHDAAALSVLDVPATTVERRPSAR